MVVLATQWPATTVLPGPHPKRTCVGRPCRLVDEPIGLAFRVTRDAAKTFLHFAAHVPGGTGYTIFIHRSVLAGVIWSDFVSLQAAMKELRSQ
jgi:hypothetical protein